MRIICLRTRTDWSCYRIPLSTVDECGVCKWQRTTLLASARTGPLTLRGTGASMAVLRYHGLYKSLGTDRAMEMACPDPP